MENHNEFTVDLARACLLLLHSLGIECIDTETDRVILIPSPPREDEDIPLAVGALINGVITVLGEESVLDFLKVKNENPAEQPISMLPN